MYLWHNHQRTLWFERLHSEKTTNFYNLMSRNMSGRELPGLYDPAWVHVKKKLTTHLSECIWLWPESNSNSRQPSLPLWAWWNIWLEARFLLHEQYWSPEREVANQCITAHKLLYVCKFGTSWVDWDDSDRERDNGGYKSGYDTEQGEAGTKWKKKNPNTKPHSSTPVNRRR